MPRRGALGDRPIDGRGRVHQRDHRDALVDGARNDHRLHALSPLRAAALIGLVGILTALGYAGYALYAKLVLAQSPQGFTALLAAVVFLAGLQLLFLGVIGEYVGRIYEETKARPLYVVERVSRGS